MTYTLLMFTGACCSAVDETNAAAVVLTEYLEAIASPARSVTCYDIYEQPDATRIQHMFAGRQRYAGLATRVAWSPTEDGASSPSWCLVTVGARSGTRLAVRRIDEDVRWTLLDFAYAPRFAASTAEAMRKWLNHDFSAPIRYGGDPRLFEQVRKMNASPTGEGGTI